MAKRHASSAVTSGCVFDPRECLPGFLAIIQGLKHAHVHGVVHLDVKGDNILLQNERNFHTSITSVADFGLARYICHLDRDPAASTCCDVLRSWAFHRDPLHSTC